jgi:hypothetical protein
MFGAPDEEMVSDEVGVYDAPPTPIPPEGKANPAEQLRHLRRLHVVDLDHMKAIFRPDSCGPDPLGHLVGMGSWAREEQVEGPRHPTQRRRVERRGA